MPLYAAIGIVLSQIEYAFSEFELSGKWRKTVTVYVFKPPKYQVKFMGRLLGITE
jgi:hypothetical protein